MTYCPKPSNYAEHDGAPAQLVADNPFEDSESIITRKIVTDSSVNRMRACYGDRPYNRRKKLSRDKRPTELPPSSAKKFPKLGR